MLARMLRWNRKQLCLMAVVLVAGWLTGCAKPPEYGVERRLKLPDLREQVWAVAPAINLSGQPGVDPLLQADLLFKELQVVRGVKAIPVNRVAEAYAALRITGINSAEQAAAVCEVLGCDALLVPTVTIYDPYEPPKMGVSLQLFFRDPSAYAPRPAMDVRELERMATPRGTPGLPPPELASFVQEVGMFDAAHGSVRKDVLTYAKGRADPVGPTGVREYFLVMDRYASFVYHALLDEMIETLELREAALAGLSTP